MSEHFQLYASSKIYRNTRWIGLELGECTEKVWLNILSKNLVKGSRTNLIKIHHTVLQKSSEGCVASTNDHTSNEQRAYLLVKNSACIHEHYKRFF